MCQSPGVHPSRIPTVLLSVPIPSRLDRIASATCEWRQVTVDVSEVCSIPSSICPYHSLLADTCTRTIPTPSIHTPPTITPSLPLLLRGWMFLSVVCMCVAMTRITFSPVDYTPYILHVVDVYCSDMYQQCITG